MNKKKLWMILGGLLTVGVIAAGSFYMGWSNALNTEPSIGAIGMSEDCNQHLPLTWTGIDPDAEFDPEGKAYVLLNDFMAIYRSRELSEVERLQSVGFDDFKYLSGDENVFTVGALFRVHPEKVDDLGHSYWGTAEDDDSVRNLYWKLTIQKESNGTYTLTSIAPDSALAIDTGMINYQIQDERVELTFDSGIHWQSVPISLDLLFGGQYDGDRGSGNMYYYVSSALSEQTWRTS